MTFKGVNIYSGTLDGELAAALTNPTELARRKGKLSTSYPIHFYDRAWRDVEESYLALAKFERNEMQCDVLMAKMIATKFLQHPRLIEGVKQAGGALFLMACRHFTGRTNEWTGAGMQSRFIRNLVCGYTGSFDEKTPSVRMAEPVEWLQSYNLTYVEKRHTHADEKKRENLADFLARRFKP